MIGSPLLSRVVLRNYKSIAACDVRLGPLSFLLGPNGSGKSNFLDALCFVNDALVTTLDHALRERGGINEVRRRSHGHPTHFGIRLEFLADDRISGHYALEVGARHHGGHEVQREECFVYGPDPLERHEFTVASDNLDCSSPAAPGVSRDRLYLVAASGLAEFRPAFDALTGMRFYNPSPASIRDLQSPDSGEMLQRNGGNLAGVLARLKRNSPARATRIDEYLSKLAPGISGVDARSIGPKETLEFRQTTPGSEEPWRFLAESMSDGTLRALGVLVALLQGGDGPGGRTTLTGIENPGSILHPAAAGVLYDALREASQSQQVAVTSHTPDLLDRDDIPQDSILAVVADTGATQIAPVSAVGRTALRERLYTPGELLRLNQLQPDSGQIPNASQLNLFGVDEDR